MPCCNHILTELEPVIQDAVERLRCENTLAAMVLVAFQFARQVAVILVQEVLSERAQQRTEWPRCPKCNASLHSKGLRGRSVMTIIGLVKWNRQVGRCPNGCKVEEAAPFDVALGLLPNQRTSNELKRVACALSIFVPFSTASLLLQYISGIMISAGTIWKWVEQAGDAAMKDLQQKLKSLEEGNTHDEHVEPAVADFPLVLGADGVMVPFRPNKGNPKGRTVWHEVKVGIVTRLIEEVKRGRKVVTRLTARRLVAVLGDIDALQLRLRWLAITQGLLTARRVVWISDGARGLWRIYETSFASHAKGILDFYHAAQHLWQGVQDRFGGPTVKAYAWFSELRHKLRHGEHCAVIDDIQRALQLTGLPRNARESLSKLYAYLVTHKEHLDYKKMKQLGMPIGSGMVESACKWLIQQRFKGVGMRWSEDGFNHLLHLRLAWVNGTFDSFFSSPKS